MPAGAEMIRALLLGLLLAGCGPVIEGTFPRVRDAGDDRPEVCTHRLGLSASCWGCREGAYGDLYCDRQHIGPVIEWRL